AVELVQAMTSSGLGISNSDTDQIVFNSYSDLEKQLISTNGSNWYTIKILSAFARAGIFVTAKDAIIDINDDYLNRASVSSPIFTVWTGEDYTFNANGSAV